MIFKRRQRLILSMITYGISPVYLIILILLAQASDPYPYYLEMGLIFGCGAIFSLVLSIFLIRHHKVHDTPFEKTLYRLMITQIPIMVSLFIIFMVYPF